MKLSLSSLVALFIVVALARPTNGFEARSIAAASACNDSLEAHRPAECQCSYWSGDRDMCTALEWCTWFEASQTCSSTNSVDALAALTGSPPSWFASAQNSVWDAWNSINWNKVNWNLNFGTRRLRGNKNN